MQTVIEWEKENNKEYPLRAAVITDGKDFVEWIGNECIGAVVPRRNAQNKAVKMGMLSC